MAETQEGLFKTVTNPRSMVYVDGFNLYHGLKNLKKSHLKWLNLRSLVEKFLDKQSEVIEKITDEQSKFRIYTSYVHC